MLNVTNTLAIGPFLDVLMFPIGGNDRSRAVARCIWVKNPYVKICILCSSPEPSGSNVKTGFICSDGSLEGDHGRDRYHLLMSFQEGLEGDHGRDRV